MNKLKTEIICFDLFNTLIREPKNSPSYTDTLMGILQQKGVENSGSVRSRIYPYVRDELMIRSKNTYDEMVLKLLMYLELDKMIPNIERKRIVDAWRASNEGIEWIDGATDVLGNVRDQARQLVVASNVTSPAWETVNKKLQISQRFDQLFLSCKKYVSKPNAVFWNNIDNNLPKNNLWMIGDSIDDDIKPPFQRGWNVIPILQDKDLFSITAQIQDKINAKRTDAARGSTLALIVDIPIISKVREDFKDIAVSLLDVQELSRKLLQWKGWELFDPAETLLVFPGEGAKILKNYLPSEFLNRWSAQAFISVSRKWNPGQKPMIMGGEMGDGFEGQKFKNIVILDDAISSGGTANAIFELNKNKFPNASWNLISWVTQNSAKVANGFSQVFAATSVGSPSMKKPLNSLSKLVEDPAIAQSLADRNLGADKDAFLSIVQSIND